MVPASRAWRDLDSAVSAACTDAGLAVTRTTSPAPGIRRYDLLSITDLEGSLTATAPAGYIDADSPIAHVVPVADTRLECIIGGPTSSLRDHDRELAFMRAIKDWRPKFVR